MSKPPITVLLVEDDEGHLFLTREALTQEGFQVEVCRTGHEALEHSQRTDYHVYVIDVKLPDLTGLEVLRRLTTLKPGIVAIIVSGHGDEMAAVEAMKAGAYDYVVKSPSMGHLATLPVVIREVLARRQLKEEREQLQNELWEHTRLLEERNMELRRANEELKRLNQLKSDFVTMVSHELRTPMSTVKEFAGIIQEGIAGPTSPEQRQYLAIIQENVDRLSRIINDLLDMAQIESGQLLLNKVMVDPVPLVQHVLQSMRPLAATKGLTLDVSASTALPGIFADEDKVTQVLINLVSNAIKFTEPGGRIEVSAFEESHDVEFSVSDTGIGIAAADLPKLFEKFQQLHRDPRETVGKGTGLGLAISKRLVELHGGRIQATSEPGRGSLFSFTLPKHQPDEIFREYLHNGIEQAKRRQSRFSISVISVTNFLELKARYGLEEANRILRELERFIKHTVRRRAGDVVTRWQRGEMVVILAEVDQAGSRAITDRIGRLVAQQTFVVGSDAVKLFIIAATATYPDEAVTDEELIKMTEMRLHQLESKKLRVLVVDDEPKTRELLRGALEHHGYEVLTASHGPEALQQLKEQAVDLILLDLMMPVMDGYELYHLLREDPRTKHVPVIIVTAKGDRKDRQLGLSHATYNYVEKPFQFEALFAKMDQVLDQREGAQR